MRSTLQSRSKGNSVFCISLKTNKYKKRRDAYKLSSCLRLSVRAFDFVALSQKFIASLFFLLVLLLFVHLHLFAAAMVRQCMDSMNNRTASHINAAITLFAMRGIVVSGNKLRRVPPKTITEHKGQVNPHNMVAARCALLPWQTGWQHSSDFKYSPQCFENKQQ